MLSSSGRFVDYAGISGLTAKPVDILDEIEHYLRRYMYFSNEYQPLVLALFILHTYEFQESFPRTPWTTPYIYIYSTGPACGKSLLLDLLANLTHKPRKSGSMSAAAMYRVIEERLPTVLVDEIDTVFRGSSSKYEDLRNTLNTGYKHGGTADRVSGNEVQTFRTFCPKVLAGIRDEAAKVEIPETVRTRSIPIVLTRKPADAETEEYYSFIAEPIGEELAHTIRAWVRLNGDQIIDYMPKPSEGLHSRAFEISMPLIQIARVLGVEDEAREALAALLAPEPERELPAITMLRKIKTLFTQREAEKLYSRDIAALFGWTTKKLAGELAKFEITGNNTMQIDGQKPAKGYWRSQFVAVWERFDI